MSHTQGLHPKPILFVDVDGVISLFGFSSTAAPPGALHRIDGQMHCIDGGTGDRLTRLAEHFELVWATGWEEKANEHLPQLLGLSVTHLPSLTFGGAAVFGSSHWKLDAISAYAGDRPVAWVDDNMDDPCRFWALAREAPTLLVETQSGVGLQDEHVAQLAQWADTCRGADRARDAHAA